MTSETTRIDPATIELADDEPDDLDRYIAELSRTDPDLSAWLDAELARDERAVAQGERRPPASAAIAWAPMAGAPTAYQPSAAEGRECPITVGRQPADADEARAWLAQLDREAAAITAQLAAAGDEDWRRRARRALAVKVAKIARLEGWLLRHPPAILGTLASTRGVRPVTPADLDRWEAPPSRARGGAEEDRQREADRGITRDVAIEAAAFSQSGEAPPRCRGRAESPRRVQMATRVYHR